jgi:hypothetical protein
MNLKHILAALALGVAAGGAGAAGLTFDGLTDFQYGSGFPLTDDMAYSGQNLTYREAGYQLTLHAPGAAAGAAHVGDGTFEPQTFNWHDGWENGAGTFVTLTRIDGGLFDLLGFDYVAYGLDGSALWADGSLRGILADAGAWGTALHGIGELRLVSGAVNQLDNIHVEDAQQAGGTVPLPGTLPLLLGGLAAAATVRRRRETT